MEKAKELLERLWDLNNKPQSSGMNVLSELQELLDMTQSALDEVYDAERTMNEQNDLLTHYERDGAA